MSPSLRALLEHVIDYAGLFPPAQLPLDQAIRNYAHYRTEPESWMLGRFICPAARLAELSPFVDELFRAGPPLSVSALGRGGGGGDSFLAGLRQDLADIAVFGTRHGQAVSVGVIETRLPPGAGGELNASAADLVASDGPPDGTLFLEATLGPDWRSSVAAVLGAVAAGRGRTFHLPVGFKLRCGGVGPGACPPVEQVAFALTAARDARVPLKFTAGLHHPIYRPDAPMHGFLNVFVAGVLAHARGLSEADLRPLVAETDAKAFAFGGGDAWRDRVKALAQKHRLSGDDLHSVTEAARGSAFMVDTLAWRDVRATVWEIEAARREGVISFGSCSFDEPRDDLRALGLL